MSCKQQIGNSCRFSRGLLIGIALTIILAGAAVAQAGIVWWSTAGTSNWATTANWYPSVPGAADTVNIANGNNATAIVDNSTGSVSCANLQLGNQGYASGPGYLNMQGGGLTVSGTVYLEYGSVPGIINQSGGVLSSATEDIGYNVVIAVAHTQTDGQNTVGSLVFGHSTSGVGGYYYLNGGTLTAGTISKISGTATIGLGGGTLQAPSGGLTSSSVTMTLTPGTTSTIDTQSYTAAISGVISPGTGTGTAGALTKIGVGMLTLSGANTYTGLTTVSAGTLTLAGTSITTPRAWKPVLSNGGASITGGQIVFDYTGGTDPVSTVEGLLATSYASGWTTGQFRTTAGHALGWADDGTNHKVIVQYTLPGDVNLDGKVDGTDLNDVLSSYGASSGATWAMGDFNYDGAVDGTDLNIVLSNYGSVLSATAAVPEPGALGLLALGALGLLAYAWRKRK